MSTALEMPENLRVDVAGLLSEAKTLGMVVIINPDASGGMLFEFAGRWVLVCSPATSALRIANLLKRFALDRESRTEFWS